MEKQAAFEFKLDPDLGNAFVDAAKSADRIPEEVIAELVRDYVDLHQDDAGYHTFLSKKVATARRSMNAGRGKTSDEVDSLFAALREEVRKTAR